MSTIRDIHGRDLIDFGEIKKRWKQYAKEPCRKDPNEPDDYDSVVSHPEPDTLESEVKWALGSTAANTASRCDGTDVELSRSLKDDAIKVFH